MIAERYTIDIIKNEKTIDLIKFNLLLFKLLKLCLPLESIGERWHFNGIGTQSKNRNHQLTTIINKQIKFFA